MGKRKRRLLSVTLPQDLYARAKEEGIPFTATLEDAIRAKLEGSKGFKEARMTTAHPIPVVEAPDLDFEDWQPSDPVKVDLVRRRVCVGCVKVDDCSSPCERFRRAYGNA